jgi:O-antigen/teichoic acid export membrane protein
VVVIIIARLLGPAGYGLYVLSFVLPSLFVSLADFGLSPALTRYGASLRSQNRFAKLGSMIRSGLLFKFIIGLAVFLFVFALSGPLAATVLQRGTMGQLVALASFTILFQGLFTLSSSAFVGLDRMGQSAIIQVLYNIVRMILSPLLILLGFGVAGGIGGQIFGWIIASMFGVWLLLAHRQGLRNMPSETEPSSGTRDDLRMMMGYGFPLYVASIVTIILTQYQSIVLAFFTSNAEIGNFSAAFNFGALVGVVATPIATALFPAFSKLDLQTQREDLRRMLELSVKYASFLILPVTIAIAFLSKDLIRAIYGASYSFASTYLALYVCIFLLTSLGYQILGNFFNGIGRTMESLKMGVVQLAIFLFTAPVMAWLYRVPGLIVALLLSALAATIFGLNLATRKYGMHLDLTGSLRSLLAALASALPILPLVYYPRLPSLANAVIGACIYLAAYLTLAPVFKAIKRTDLEILAPLLGRIRILKPATDLIFAYETRLLNMIERSRSQSPTAP